MIEAEGYTMNLQCDECHNRASGFYAKNRKECIKDAKRSGWIINKLGEVNCIRCIEKLQNERIQRIYK